MKTLTCPIPTNINPLQNNGFLFNITKLPEIQFFCQEVTLPEITLPSASFDNPLVRIPFAGDKLNFGDLQISFMINENMENYSALYDWMIGLGFPESHDQYSAFLHRRKNALSPNNATADSSDGILQILGSNNTPVKTIRFMDIVPSALGSIQMQTVTQDTTYILGQATFAFTSFNFI